MLDRSRPLFLLIAAFIGLSSTGEDAAHAQTAAQRVDALLQQGWKEFEAKRFEESYLKYAQAYEQARDISHAKYQTDAQEGRLYAGLMASNQRLQQQRSNDALDLLLAIADAEKSDGLPTELRKDYWSLRAALTSAVGGYSDAYRCYERVLQIQNDPLSQAVVEIALAQMLVRIGDYRSAELRLTDAQEMLDAGTNTAQEVLVSADRFRAQIQLEQANIHRLQGQFDAARNDVEQARRLLKDVLKRHDALPPAMQTPGFAEIIRGFLILADNRQATILYAEGRLPEAKELWISVRKQFDQNGQASDRTGECDINLGWLAWTEGHAAEAERLFRSALAVFQQHNTQRRIPEAQACLARVLTADGRVDEAKRLLDDALSRSRDDVNRVLASAISGRDRQAFLLELRNHNEQPLWPGVFDAYLELAPQLKIPDEEQYQRVLEWKGVLADYEASATDTVGDERATLVSEREDVMRQLSRFAVARGADGELNDRAVESLLPKVDADNANSIAERYDAAVRALELRSADLERQIRRASGTQPLSQQPPLTPQTVAEKLPLHSVFVDFVEAARFERPKIGRTTAPVDVIAFVCDLSGNWQRLKNDRGESRLCDADRIAEAAQELLDEFREAVPYEYVRQELLDVDDEVGKPLRPFCVNARHVIISGDGWIHRIPWVALPPTDARDDRQFWVQEVAFSSTPSARSFVRRTERIAQPIHKALLVGGIVYDGRDSQGRIVSGPWPALPAAAEEIDAVRHELEQVTPAPDIEVLRNEQPTKAALIDRLRDKQLVHISTHGYFKERDSDLGGVYGAAAAFDSGIVLANANLDSVTGSTYVLTAEELGSLNLSSVELFALPSCSTALGHLRRGEGVIGLLGSLGLAGVRIAIAPLWEVDDRATQRLIALFYQHAIKTNFVSPAQSLREAQMQFINDWPQHHKDFGSRDSKVAPPYYWAAFTITGQSS